MSSMCGTSLEFFVEDSFIRITKDQEVKIIELLEPSRESIEYSMMDFDEDSQSWREYRNNMWSWLDEYDKKIDSIINLKQEQSIKMIKLEYYNGNQWVACGEWASEKLAWVSLGGDDLNYRTVEAETGKVLTDKSK